MEFRGWASVCRARVCYCISSLVFLICIFVPSLTHSDVYELQEVSTFSSWLGGQRYDEARGPSIALMYWKCMQVSIVARHSLFTCSPPPFVFFSHSLTAVVTLTLAFACAPIRLQTTESRPPPPYDRRCPAEDSKF